MIYTNSIKVGLIQMGVVDSKEKNLKKSEEMIKKAVSWGAQLIVLPEMFNCPYSNDKFSQYAEEEKGYSWQRLSCIAQENRIILVGGSIPELDEKGKVYNTSYIFDGEGKQIGKHRKIHLFDIDIEGGQYFKESDTLSPGNTVTVIDTPLAKIGVMICYDLRFPELARLMVQKGADIIIVPGAFNMTTGPAHWKLLFRSRALDNQVYTIGTAPARDNQANYVSYANSLIVDPWGSVINELGEEEGILLEEVDLERVQKIRQELPLIKHLRKDLYRLIETT